MQQYGNSLISDPHRFVLWWHAKSGCTTLKVWYLDLFGYQCEQINDGTHNMWAANGESVHSRIHQWKNKFNPKEHENYFHFTVVRHPLARLVSHWDQQVTSGTEKRSLARYIQYVVAEPQATVDPHIARQHARLADVKMNLWIRLEEINNYWLGLMDFLQLPAKPLPVRNRRGAGDKWEEVLSDKTLRKIAEQHYEEDLALYYS